MRLRLDGRDHFINRLGRFDDLIAQARGQAICAKIWRDAQRHSFLSHAHALGNSSADLAVVAGHRTEELLRTYAKPKGRVRVPTC